MAESIPEYIEIGTFKFAYEDCNDYQRSIYEMLSIYTQILGRSIIDVSDLTEEQKEYLRVAGVVRFLKSRLLEFGDVERVPRDMYDNLELQLKALSRDQIDTW